MIQVTEKHLELSAYKGTKKVCETADILSCKHVFSHRIERIKRMQNESSGEGNQKSVKSVTSDVKKKETTEDTKERKKIIT